MTYSDIDDGAEFCRHCGITVSWTGENWVHDYRPSDDHEPVVPYEPGGYLLE